MHSFNQFRFIAVVGFVAFALFVSSCSDSSTGTDPDPEPEPNPEPQTINWSDAADSSTVNGLMGSYWNNGQGYFNYSNLAGGEFQYWPNAHGLDVVLDAYGRTDDTLYESYINDWYNGVNEEMNGSFINDFYDDMEWNALAMLRAYDMTSEEKFRTTVLTLWDEIKGGWTDVGGGGIMWAKHTPRSKNAISNSPASILASRLYQLTGDEDKLEWAKQTYHWVKNNLVDHNSGAVWDHMEVDANGNENIQKNWIFTYNQGVYLGAALELYEITGEQSYLTDAVKAADYTLNNLTNTTDRLLKDEGTGDGGLFKGIFIRYFTQLILEEDLSESNRNRYVQFLEHNATILWREGTNKNFVLFDQYWNESPGNNEQIDLTVQLSGAMLIEAAATLENQGYFED